MKKCMERGEHREEKKIKKTASPNDFWRSCIVSIWLPRTHPRKKESVSGIYIHH